MGNEIGKDHYKGSAVSESITVKKIKPLSELPDKDLNRIEKALEDNFEKGLMSVDVFDNELHKIDVIKAGRISQNGKLKPVHIIDKNGKHTVKWKLPEDAKNDHHVGEGHTVTYKGAKHTVHKVKEDGYWTLKDENGKKHDKSPNRLEVHKPGETQDTKPKVEKPAQDSKKEEAKETTTKPRPEPKEKPTLSAKEVMDELGISMSDFGKYMEGNWGKSTHSKFSYSEIKENAEYEIKRSEEGLKIVNDGLKTATGTNVIAFKSNKHAYEETISQAKALIKKIESKIASGENTPRVKEPERPKAPAWIPGARAPKTVEQLKAAIAYSDKMFNENNKKKIEIDSQAPGGGSWSSRSPQGKKSDRFSKMSEMHRSNRDKWTDKLNSVSKKETPKVETPRAEAPIKVTKDDYDNEDYSFEATQGKDKWKYSEKPRGEAYSDFYKETGSNVTWNLSLNGKSVDTGKFVGLGYTEGKDNAKQAIGNYEMKLKIKNRRAERNK
jgi:hypothetical protein